jgi:hypothetical protein
LLKRNILGLKKKIFFLIFLKRLSSYSFILIFISENKIKLKKNFFFLNYLFIIFFFFQEMVIMVFLHRQWWRVCWTCGREEEDTMHTSFSMMCCFPTQ